MKPADLLTISAAMPDCRLVIVPGIGNSMNLEVPALYAGYFGAWFGAFRTIVRYERSKAVADINPSENVRAMLTETLGRLRKASV